MRSIRVMLPRLALAALLLAPAGAVPAAAECQFVLGFKTLHDLIPGIMGDCRTDEFHNPDNGDGLQLTTGGLLVWRKADNWTAFTDGTTTWINGPFGLASRPNEGPLFSWEAAAPLPVVSAPAPAPATPTPPASPASIPAEASAVVQRVVADAARRTGLDPAGIRVVSVEARDWPDSSLGCPKPGFFYSQVVTPGYLIVLDAAGQRLEYHSDRSRQIVLC